MAVDRDKSLLKETSVLEPSIIQCLIQARVYDRGGAGVRLLPVIFWLPGAVRQQRGPIGSPAILGHTLAQVADLPRLPAMHREQVNLGCAVAVAQEGQG